MICNTCKKDHKIKNTGLLTECEKKEYFGGGGVTAYDRNNGKYRAFGIGNRFQFEEAG